MKEVTYEEWIENPTPRLMWVWDNDETCMKKMKVLFVFSNKCEGIKYPVIVLSNNGKEVYRYKHCAETAKKRKITNKELAR